MTNHARLAAGATLLLLSGQYFAAEAIAAAAWIEPYSYSRNFISDLGITACAVHAPCSPLGVVMNGALILSGVLAIGAAASLVPLVPRPWMRWALMGFATAHGLGSAGVGLVESAPGTAAGTPHLHIVAAYAAVVGGNLALLTAGCGVGPRWMSEWFRVLTITLGIYGLCSGLALVVARGLPPGLLERGAVDTVPLWQMLAGACLALRLLRQTASQPDSPPPQRISTADTSTT